MVRISDIVQLKPARVTPTKPQAGTGTQVAQLPRAPQSVAEPSMETPSASASQSLYTELVESCQRAFDDVVHEPHMALGHLPALTERLVNRLASHDAELIRLSTAGENGFSLAVHGTNVAILSVLVGMELGFKKTPLVELALAAVLHDVGMLKLSHVVQSPTSLNAEQRTLVHEHPVLGNQLLERCPGLEPFVRQTIAQEHERYDGSGYPHRLAGPRISEPAQVVGLLDCYEALVHERPYRHQGLVPSEATRTILRDQRTAFREDFLRAFLQVVPVYPVGSWVQLSSGESAKVIALTPPAVLSPTVTIFLDEHGRLRPRPDTVNLAKDPRLIVRAIPEPLLQG